MMHIYVRIRMYTCITSRACPCRYISVEVSLTKGPGGDSDPQLTKVVKVEHICVRVCMPTTFVSSCTLSLPNHSDRICFYLKSIAYVCVYERVHSDL